MKVASLPNAEGEMAKYIVTARRMEVLSERLDNTSRRVIDNEKRWFLCYEATEDMFATVTTTDKALLAIKAIEEQQIQQYQEFLKKKKNT